MSFGTSPIIEISTNNQCWYVLSNQLNYLILKIKLLDAVLIQVRTYTMGVASPIYMRILKKCHMWYLDCFCTLYTMSFNLYIIVSMTDVEFVYYGWRSSPRIDGH